jgi:gas vesicle protein
MDRTDQIRRTSPVVAALVIGSLVGAGAMMLLAPQSGKETRSKIQHKTMELRDRTVGGVKDTVKDLTSRSKDLRNGVKDRADGIQQQSRDLLAKELEIVADAAKRARKVVKG